MEKTNFDNEYLAFVIDDKTFAVPILSLQNVIGNPNIIPISDSMDFVVGLCLTQDSKIPVLDLRTILNKPNAMHPNKTCVVVARVNFKGVEKSVGFIVDFLFNLYNIDKSEIKKLPHCDSNKFVESVTNQKDKMILMLNMENIINQRNVIRFLNHFWQVEDKYASNTSRRN